MKRNLVLSILALAVLAACKLSMFTPAPAKTVLAEVLQGSESCRSTAGVEAADNTVSFSCSNSADTFYTVSMTHFASQADAQAQFEASRGANPLLCFHGYNQYETYSSGTFNQYIVNEQLGWQAETWVVSINASYDYGYFHYTSSGFSEAVYASAVEHHLFPAGTCP
jgi:hypothetical protein